MEGRGVPTRAGEVLQGADLGGVALAGGSRAARAFAAVISTANRLHHAVETRGAAIAALFGGRGVRVDALLPVPEHALGDAAVLHVLDGVARARPPAAHVLFRRRAGAVLARLAARRPVRVEADYHRLARGHRERRAAVDEGAARDLRVEEVVQRAVVLQATHEAAEVLARHARQELLAARQRLDGLRCLLQDAVDGNRAEVLVRGAERLQAARRDDREVLALLHPRRAPRARVVLERREPAGVVRRVQVRRRLVAARLLLAVQEE